MLNASSMEACLVCSLLFCPVAYLYNLRRGTAGDMLCHSESGPIPPGTRWAPEIGGFLADEALGTRQRDSSTSERDIV